MAVNSWSLVKKGAIPKLKNPVLIEGLPGIGNVGKVAVDFVVDELKAEKIYDFFSYAMPHSVFVNEQHLVELPTISVYYKKVKSRDILFVAGDFQPIDERSCYSFSDCILDMLQSFNGKELITLGGIGLPAVPRSPRVYCTGTSKEVIERYQKKGKSIEPKLYGVVGPIIGVSGLLLGLAKKREMDAIALLAETYGHPMYLGIRGAREIVKVLTEEFQLGINMKELDYEITQLEAEAVKQSRSATLNKALRGLKKSDVNYIG